MAPQRRNIIFIMVDDLAAKTISAYGAGINNTPNIDRLAKEGMLFNHCYVTNVNLVHTLDSKIDKQLPNVAKQLKAYGNYQTAMIGKWHLGEGKAHEPSGFDYWDIVPGQGQYWDPLFINEKGQYKTKGYATDIITKKSLDWIKSTDPERPFFVQVHHKAPHRPWECHSKYRDWYKDEIKVPETFSDDYKNRAKAASVAKMKVAVDMTYLDLGLVQPEGGEEEVGEIVVDGHWQITDRKVPYPEDVTKMRPLVCRETGERFTFKTKEELAKFKYQRYMQRYLRTVQSVDDSVGEILEFLDAEGLADNTQIWFTSDQGFYIGEHGWFDKRFLYEESFQMPLLIRSPGLVKPGSVCNDILSNVDFAPTFLDFAGLRKPTYMQGDSFVPSLAGTAKQDPDTVAYHRYFMHADECHNAYAHYGVRGTRYKLIFWYNDGLGLPGVGPADPEQEWELFDCDADPLELFNLWDSADAGVAAVRDKMVRLLEAKMEEIGDEPAHPIGLSGDELRKRYPPGAGIAARAQATNML